MKKDYSVFYLSVDGKHHIKVTVSAVSFFDACKSAKSFSKHAGMIIIGVIEENTLSQNFILSLS